MDLFVIELRVRPSGGYGETCIFPNYDKFHFHVGYVYEGVFGIRPETKAKGVYSKKDLAPSGSGREFLLLFIVLHVILRDSGCRIGS